MPGVWCSRGLTCSFSLLKQVAGPVLVPHACSSEASDLPKVTWCVRSRAGNEARSHWWQSPRSSHWPADSPEARPGSADSRGAGEHTVFAIRFILKASAVEIFKHTLIILCVGVGALASAHGGGALSFLCLPFAPAAPCLRVRISS